MLSFRSTTVVFVLAGALLFGSAPSQAQSDCNANGIPDVCDLACGPVGGACDVPGCGTSADCNANGVPDECDIANCPPSDPSCQDCNLNGIPDGCDLATASWTLRSVTGLKPSARQLLGLAYESARDRTVLFGGSESAQGQVVGDTWEWDGTTLAWTPRDPGDPNGVAAPTPRALFAMAYDSVRGVTVLFGGYTSLPNVFGDTWEWDGSSWTLVHPADPTGATAPTPRRGSAMAYDSLRGVSVLFGGSDIQGGTETLRDDTWEWDGSVWNRCFPPTSPSARGGHAMTYDSTRDRTVLFGGQSSVPGVRLDDTWEWNGGGGTCSGTWTQLAVVSGPSQRNEAVMSYDSARGVAILVGGHGENIIYGDTWEWNGNSWTHRSNAGLTPHSGPGMAYEGARQMTVLFGGWDGTYFDDTWEYGLTSQDCNANGIPDGCDTDTDGDGVPDDCDQCPFDPTNTKVDGQCIPTLSEWGMITMAGLMLSAGGVVIVRRRAGRGITNYE